MADSFAHLHVHTEYSMLDGASRVDALLAAVAEMGMPACAITDHGVMFGAVDFYQAAQRYGVNPIIGMEAYMAPGSRFVKGGGAPDRNGKKEPYHHLTLLAESGAGYRNLMQLSSRAYLEGYWYKPRADLELLAESADGLICLSGCLGSQVNQLLLAGDYEGALGAAARYRDIFGNDRYFVELQDHDIPDQHKTNGQLIRIAEELGLGLVVTNDSHYTSPEDYLAHDALLCVQTGAQQSDTDRFKLHNDQFFVKPPAAMQALFPEHPETWRNTLAIAERCRVELDFATTHLPRFACPDGISEAAYLRQQVELGAAGRYGTPLPAQARERIDFELTVIGDMGFDAYFLIVADLVAYAKRNGIRVGPGRGSAAGCAVAYCTGITDLDPIAHGLLFERFLNPGRVSLPDIDIDFDERRRGEMIRYAADTYGQDHVAQIVTFQTIKAKQAIKDASRVLGYPYSFGDRLCKMFPPPVLGKESSLADARAKSGELRAAWNGEPDAAKVLDTAKGLEGLRRQHSIHAAGVVIADKPITEVCPVLRVEADGEIVTQYDGRMVEELGLLKMDFLGLRNLTVISDALDHVHQTGGQQVAIEELPLDDAPTYALISRGDTDGVFQLESAGYKALCRQLRPDRFEDIIALGALYRPGPMSANLHVEYAHRKHGRSPVTTVHDDLRDILAESYGLMIYQEQVQRIAQRIAGFSLGDADQIRKAMGKKLPAKMAALREQFCEGTVTQGYPAKLGLELWHAIEKFAGYAFNKSHAAAYGLVTYQTGWLKAHHPVEFMAALLTSVRNHKDRLPAALHSCRTMGITVLVPDVNQSATDFTPVPEQHAVRFGLSAVRNVGEQVVDQVLAARAGGGAFTDFADFCRRVDASVLNKRTVESLVKAGAFESLGHPRKGLALAVEPFVDQALATKRAEAEGQFSLFGDVADTGDAQLDVPIPQLEYDRSEKLAAERELLGLYVSDHPLLGLERILGELASAPIPELLERGSGSGRAQATIAGLVTAITKKFTKKGELYVVANVEDLRGAIEVMVFPTVYAQATALLVEDAVVVVTGRLDDGEVPRMLATEVRAPDLTDLDGGTLVVELAPQQATSELLTVLRDLLAEHPGHTPVQVRLRTGARTSTLRLADSLCVRRTPGLAGELKALLGPAAIG